jgi:hypothetical protein
VNAGDRGNLTKGARVVFFWDGGGAQSWYAGVVDSIVGQGPSVVVKVRGDSRLPGAS